MYVIFEKTHFIPMTLDERLARKISELEPAFDLIPGAVIIHYLHPHRLLYMNRYGVKNLNTTLEELRNMGNEYYDRFFNIEDADEYVPKVLNLVAHNNDKELISFFQQVRPTGESEWRWHLCGTRIFFHDDAGKPYATISVAIPIDKEHYYTRKIERLLEENLFLKNNSALFASLSVREKEILTLTAQGVSTFDIAARLYLSEETVKTHRRNIKRKLKAESQLDIVKFAQAFNLI